MYDSPKAIHFTAQCTISGQDVPRWDEGGLAVRWEAARIAESLGITDMMVITQDQWDSLLYAVSGIKSSQYTVTIAWDVPKPWRMVNGMFATID